MVQALTIEERHTIKSTMSDTALEVLYKHRIYQLNSEFHTRIFASDSEWQFVDFNENVYYGTPDNAERHKLYCECGQQLRYQYVIESTNTKEIKLLGITHFQQHTGVPSAVANRVRSGIQRIDRWLDNILMQYPTYETDTKQQSVLNALKEADKPFMMSFTRSECEIIKDFIEVGLPLPMSIVNTTINKMKRSLTKDIYIASITVTKSFNQLTHGEGLSKKELRQLIVESGSSILNKYSIDEALSIIFTDIKKKSLLKVKPLNDFYYKV